LILLRNVMLVGHRSSPESHDLGGDLGGTVQIVDDD
jgi:hypothetical protein